MQNNYVKKKKKNEKWIFLMERQCLICGESRWDSSQIKHYLSIKNIIFSFFLSLYFFYHVYILLIILHFLSIFTITKSQKNECPKMHIFNRKTISNTWGIPILQYLQGVLRISIMHFEIAIFPKLFIFQYFY